MKPTVYLLCGLTGSGKTTYARGLEELGAVRLAVDEEVYARNGRYGVDYPEDQYFAREAAVVGDLHQRLRELIASGTSVIWDHGLWSRDDRDAMKRLVTEAGGSWQLLYFRADRATLVERLRERNQRTDANALTVTEEALDEFVARFEPPAGEGEHVIETT